MCKLRKESCEKQRLIEFAYDGVCDKCKTKFCDFYGHCIDDGIEEKCICPDECADVYIPVCGDNGITYTSACHLQLDSCVKQIKITIQHSGDCGMCFFNFNLKLYI